MTYTALVRGSSPIGYWKLNGSGSAVVGTAATVSNASAYWTTPPLVANSGSSLKITSGGASVSIYDSSFNNFYKNYERKVFSVDFWFSFNASLDGSGYIQNLDSSTRYYSDYKLKIIRIMNNATEIGGVLYDYTKNTFRFYINGSGNRDAYFTVKNLNTSFHIAATYNAGTLKIVVNGETGVRGYATDTSVFPLKSTSSVTYRIDGSSINSPSVNYVIGEVAMYNYELSESMLENRIVRALSPDKPIAITNFLQTSYFDFTEKNYHMSYKDIISGEKFGTNNLYEENLVVDRIEGIKPIRLNDLHAPNEFPDSTVSITSSGTVFSSSTSALVFDEYGKMFDSKPYKIISCMFTPLNASGGYIFSIPDSIDSKNSLYAYASSSGVTFGSYDVALDTASPIATIETALSASVEYSFALCIDGNQNATAFVSDSGETFTIENFNIVNSHYLVIGNLVDAPSTNNLRIRNFGMDSDTVNNFAGYNFEENKFLMARLTLDYSISQMSTLIKTIPLGSFGNEIIGSRISWDGMDNCMVESSIDGETWDVVRRGTSIQDIAYGDINRDVLIKISVPYEYTIENFNQSFNNFEISLYKSLSFISDDGSYSMNPSFDNSASPSYTIKRHSQPIIFRQDKPGIYFDVVEGYVNGYACVVPTSSVTNAYALDFWFKPDNFLSASNFLVHVSSSTNYYIYVDGSTKKFIYSPSAAKLYINGASVSSNSYTASTGEFYHLFFDLSGSVSNSASIFLNGYSTSSGVHTNGSYAHLNIWNDPIESESASSRYGHFVLNNVLSIEDSTTLYWQENWNSSSVSSASGYVIG